MSFADGPPGSRFSTVFRLSSAGTGPVLVFCPDVGGNFIYARGLIRALGPGPVSLGLRPAPEMLANLSTLTIEAAARRFAEDLIAEGTGRPLRLVGFSFAGYMAAEIARQMTGLGQPPERPWILDLTARPRASLRGRVRCARGLLAPDRAQILHPPAFIRMDLSQHAEGFRPIIRRLCTLFSRYRLKRWPGPATIIVAEGAPGHRPPADLGWGRYIATGLDCISVPGDHLGMMHQPDNAAALAARFHDRFRRGAGA